MKSRTPKKMAPDDGLDTVGATGFASAEFFFSQELDCHFSEKGFPLAQKLDKKHLLPNLSKAFGHDSFAQVLMGWNASGLFWQISCETEKIAVFYPEITKGDSIELFIDTRNVKQAKTTHRYCHHFFFLPEAVEGYSCGEITRFRTEDSHMLAASRDLECQVERKGKSYRASIFIPTSCLVGYAPDESSAIGFSYRISRFQNDPQLFGLSPKLAHIEYVPYLWNTLNLRQK